MVTKGRGLFSAIISRCKNHKIIILYSKNLLLTGDYIFIILIFFDLILQDLFGGEAQAVRWVGRLLSSGLLFYGAKLKNILLRKYSKSFANKRAL